MFSLIQITQWMVRDVKEPLACSLVDALDMLRKNVYNYYA